MVSTLIVDGVIRYATNSVFSSTALMCVQSRGPCFNLGVRGLLGAAPHLSHSSLTSEHLLMTALGGNIQILDLPLTSYRGITWMAVALMVAVTRDPATNPNSLTAKGVTKAIKRNPTSNTTRSSCPFG